MSCRLPMTAAALLLAASAWANVADDLRQGTQAMAQGKASEAATAFRRAFESADASAAERRQALGGLLAAAGERGKRAELMAYVQKRFAAAPDGEGRDLGVALARCRKAQDGHLHGAIADLAGQPKENRDARWLAQSLRGLAARVGSQAAEHARGVHGLMAKATVAREAKPPRGARPASTQYIHLQSPTRPAYSGVATRLARPPRTRHGAASRRLVIAVPRAPRAVPLPRLSIVKPAVRPQSMTALAARFYTQSYQRARRLTAGGLIDSAKAEYANVIVLFPRTTYARSSARYALRIFQREFPAGQQAEMLVAYLQWVRSAAGEEGLDYAEYLAITSLASKAPAAVIAEEAGAFVRRYPASEYLMAVRVQLALALERTGKPDSAIQALAPLAKLPLPAPKEGTTAAGASADARTHLGGLLILTWLHLFRGDVEKARPVLARLSEQTLSANVAADARLLLAGLAAAKPDKAILPDDAADAQPLAVQLLGAADKLRLAGQHERAMDLYALYLRAGTTRDDFTVQRDRVARYQETGRLEE